MTKELSSLIPDSVSKELPILVVDDIPSARRIVVRMLGLLGFKNVVQAESTGEALSKIKETPCQLVITDLNLKDGKGTDLFNTVQSDPVLGEQKIGFIVITSDMDKQTFTEAISFGVTSYLLKPFSAEILAERISATLGKTAG